MSFVTIPLLGTLLQLIFGPILVLSSIVVLVLAVFLTKSDPTDYTSLQENAAEEGRLNRHCTACVRRVDFTAKHCMRCNRCVVQFDHHCKVVNNCIGLANYSIFIYVMISLEVFLIGMNVSSISLIVESRIDDEEKVNGMYGGTMNWAFWVLILIAFESGVLSLLASYLLCFHLWLKCKGMTTFEYVLKRHKVVPQDTKKDSEGHSAAEGLKGKQRSESLSPTHIQIEHAFSSII